MHYELLKKRKQLFQMLWPSRPCWWAISYLKSRSRICRKIITSRNRYRHQLPKHCGFKLLKENYVIYNIQIYFSSKRTRIMTYESSFEIESVHRYRAKYLGIWSNSRFSNRTRTTLCSYIKSVLTLNIIEK